MRYSRIGFVGAAALVAVLAAAFLATLVVGAGAATTKSGHVNRTHRANTTAHLMDSHSNGGTLPFTG